MVFLGNSMDANTSSLLSRSCCDISVVLHPRSIALLVVEMNGHQWPNIRPLWWGDSNDAKKTLSPKIENYVHRVSKLF